MKLLIPDSDSTDSALRLRKWPMSVKNEKRMATTEMKMGRWAMGVSLLEHRRNEEILDEDGWNGSGMSKDEMKQKVSEQL